jgi:hypothetical protein
MHLLFPEIGRSVLQGYRYLIRLQVRIAAQIAVLLVYAVRIHAFVSHGLVIQLFHCQLSIDLTY